MTDNEITNDGAGTALPPFEHDVSLLAMQTPFKGALPTPPATGMTREQATQMLSLLGDIKATLETKLDQVIRVVDCVFVACGGWPAANDTTAKTQGLELLQKAQEQQVLAESRIAVAQGKVK